MSLLWRQDDNGNLTADSEVWHDEGVALPYTVEFDGEQWAADFEGAVIFRGSLGMALSGCEHADAKAFADTEAKSS